MKSLDNPISLEKGNNQDLRWSVSSSPQNKSKEKNGHLLLTKLKKNEKKVSYTIFKEFQLTRLIGVKTALMS